MKHFAELTTRKQYTTALKEAGPGGDDIATLTPIVGAERVPEDNVQRLILAERVLAAALTMVEFECNLDVRDLAEAKLAATPPKPPAKPPAGTGGYN
jgi:hypothetical protein